MKTLAARVKHLSTIASQMEAQREAKRQRRRARRYVAKNKPPTVAVYGRDVAPEEAATVQQIADVLLALVPDRTNYDEYEAASTAHAALGIFQSERRRT